MGNRRAIIEGLFRVTTVDAIFRDSISGSFAANTAITTPCTRLGQLCVGTQAGVVDAIYIGKSVGGTTTNGWTEISQEL